MTKAHSRIRLKSCGSDDGDHEQTDTSFISISLQTVVAKAESELNIATDQSSFDFFKDDKAVTNGKYDNVEIQNMESSASNPAESYNNFADIKFQALFDGASPGFDDNSNIPHLATSRVQNRPMGDELCSLMKKSKGDDIWSERREKSTVNIIESNIGYNDVDEDFLPNRQSLMTSIEKPIKPPRSKFVPTNVSSLKKVKQSTATPVRAFGSNIAKSKNDGGVLIVKQSTKSVETLDHSIKATMQEQPTSRSSNATIVVSKPKDELSVRNTDHSSKRGVTYTPYAISKDVAHRKRIATVSEKIGVQAATEATGVHVKEPTKRSLSVSHRNEAASTATKHTSRKSINLLVLKSGENALPRGSTSQIASRVMGPTANTSSARGTPKSVRKLKKKTRVRVPSLSPKLKRSRNPFTPAPNVAMKNEKKETLARIVSSKKISPKTGHRCKGTGPKIRIPKLQRIPPNVSASKGLTLAEETNLFLRTGFRENIPLTKDVKEFKPTVPKSPSFQKLCTTSNDRPKTKTLAEQTQAFLKSGFRNNTPIKRKGYTLTTPVSPNFSIRGRDSLNVTANSRHQFLTLAEETNLFLRTGFRENIQPTKDVKEFKPTVPKSPSFQKPCRLFSNLDLPKTKTLAEQTQAFLNSGLRNNTPIKKKSYAPTTPVSPNFSTRGRDSLNVTTNTRRKSTWMEELSIQRSCLREIKNDQSMNYQNFTMPITPNLHQPNYHHSAPMQDAQKAVTLTEKKNLFIRSGLRGSSNIPPYSIRVIKPTSSSKTEDLDMHTNTVALGMIDPWQD